MLELSERTNKLLASVFPDELSRKRVQMVLENQCGDNVPFCQDAGPESMERIRFSVLKLSEGDFMKLTEAVELANIDWRDLFMVAGFGEDTQAHRTWYEEQMKR